MEFLAAGRRGGVSVFERGAGAAGEKAGERQVKVSPAFSKAAERETASRGLKSNAKRCTKKNQGNRGSAPPFPTGGAVAPGPKMGK